MSLRSEQEKGTAVSRAIRAEALSLSEAVGQLICPTLFGAQLRGQAYDQASVLEDLARGQWGGYILFHEHAALTRSRVDALQEQSRIPLLIAADMEHGAGQQLRTLSIFPTAMAVGAANRPDLAEALGAWTAHEALSAGVNWVLAPVADVMNNPLNPIINIRSFGGDARRVADNVAAFVRGCQSQGALACAKHFPGHGDTETDSHSRLGQVRASRERLESLEWLPFKAAIAANVASIMTAHLAVPALDSPALPATLSPILMKQILRQELGFEGMIVTDAMIMGGITGTFDPLDAAVWAIAAGCDMLLMPPDPHATRQALLAAVETGKLEKARVYDAVERILKAKDRLNVKAAPPPHSNPRDLSRAMARGAITLAKGERPRLTEQTLFMTVDDGAEGAKIAFWQESLARHGKVHPQALRSDSTQADWEELFQSAEQAAQIVVGVFSPIRVSKDRSLLPETLVEQLRGLARLKPLTLVSFSSPFLVAQLPEATCWILAYGSSEDLIEAAIAAIAGESGFPGILPVALPSALPNVMDERNVSSQTPPFA